MREHAGFALTENGWRWLIAATICALLVLTAGCLAQGITAVFVHLYYIPIVLLAYHYRKKSLIPCALLGLAYFVLVTIYEPDSPGIIVGALIEVLVFIAIAVLVAYLAENLVESGETLKKHTEIQQSIAQNANVWLMVLDRNGRIREWNRAAEEMSGFTAGEVVGKNTIWKKIYPTAEYRKEITGKIAEIISKHNYLENLRTTITCKDGSEKTILWNTEELPAGTDEPARYIAVGVNITERSRAEEALRASEEKILLLLNSAAEAIYGLDMNGNCTFCNDACLRLLGYHHQDELLGKNMHVQIHSKHADGAPFPVEDCRIFQAFQRGKGTHADDEVFWRADGTSFPAEYWSYPQRYKGEIVGSVVTFLDITTRKHTEEVLHNQRWRLEAIIEGTHVGTWEWNIQTGETVFNEVWAQMIGYTLDELSPVSIKTWEALIHPDDRKQSGELLEKHFSGELPYYDCECRMRHKDGHWIWIQDRGRVITRTNDGSPLMMFGTHSDITERKQVDEALRESRQLFSDIISFLPDPTFVINRDGNVLAWNRALEKLSGIPATDMIGKGDHEYSIWQYGKRRPVLIDLVLHPEQDYGRMGYIAIQQEGQSVTAQREMILPDGRSLTLSMIASPLYDAKGAIAGAIESVRDITRIKRTEYELAHLNANLEQIVRERTEALNEEIVQRKHARQEVLDILTYTRSVIEANPDLMAVLDTNGTILDVNAVAELLTGVPREQLIGTPYSRYLVDNKNPHEILTHLIETGKAEYTIQIRRTDGHITPLSVNSTLFRGKDASEARIIVAAHDITRQKQDEEAIRASLNEKVLLLREIHHRVKNNLQIIISLTNLQARTMVDPKMKQAMAETKNRIRAMSLVHEKLYMSENISSIDLADYTRYLATQLFSFYGVDHRRVSLKNDIAKIPLDINTAIPLGLILNEIISNALKHAFPDDRSGTIRISGRSDGGLLTLDVKDDGIGLPSGFDWKSAESLGLRLINSLVDQLGGTLDLGKGPGTEFIITIPPKVE
ncbi:MAG: PAS domain S-box protein [Methanoregula sp.]